MWGALLLAVPRVAVVQQRIDIPALLTLTFVQFCAAFVLEALTELLRALECEHELQNASARGAEEWGLQITWRIWPDEDGDVRVEPRQQPKLANSLTDNAVRPHDPLSTDSHVSSLACCSID